MKHLMFISFLLSPLLASAAELAEGWTETGQAELTIDGEVMRLVVAAHPDARDFVTRRDTGGFITINAAAAGVNAQGEPDSPFVSFVIGPFTGDALPQTAWFQLYTPDGILAADIDTGSSVTLSEASLSPDGVLSFAFEGTAVAAENRDGALAPIEGAAPVPVSGTFSGQIAE